MPDRVLAGSLPSEAAAQRFRLRLRLLAAATLAAGIATATAYRRVSAPVRDLLGAAASVVVGAYRDVDVEVRGPPELRMLVATFNQMAARLAADEEQRRRFLADVTHELRNPLAVLQSELEAQLDGVHPRDDDHLASLLEETERIGYLLDDLHTLALAEAGTLVLRCQPSCVDVLVGHAVERHEARARQRGVTLRTSIGPGTYEISVDPARLLQVIDNLLSNAIRHTPPNGDVLLELHHLPARAPGAGPMVECRITDSGPGFRPGTIPDVFDRYVRAGDSSGSGLGLSIARDLVRAHGGVITAHNAPAADGACIRFELPAKPLTGGAGPRP
jgi:two-component system OmpR family sensor kinase/two-component system sensor histidine kinase BaeS